MVCGPIFSSYFSHAPPVMSTLSINQNQVLKQTKKIMSKIGTELIQIIDLLDYNINSSLSNFIFVLSPD
jgi:hypothetical protein